LRQPGGADEYPDLKIKWNPGKVPTLKLLDMGGGLQEQISLEDMDQAEIHALMVKKGFRRRRLGEVEKELDAPPIIPEEKKGVGVVEAEPGGQKKRRVHL